MSPNIRGRDPICWTNFTYWRMKRGLSARKIAAIVGCSSITIHRIGGGRRGSPVVLRMLMALFPDCPKPVAGRYRRLRRPLDPPPKHVRSPATPIKKSALLISIEKHIGKKPQE